MHDQFTREFVNVGVVLYAPDLNYLQAKIIRCYSRISQFFGGIKGDFLIAGLKRFESLVNGISDNLENSSVVKKKIDKITLAILVKDDSALQLSDEIFSGIDIDADIALADIYERLVEKYYPEETSKPHTDQYVWSNVYKKYFDQQGITKQLKKHSFNTAKDTIEFEKSTGNDR